MCRIVHNSMRFHRGQPFMINIFAVFTFLKCKNTLPLFARLPEYVNFFSSKLFLQRNLLVFSSSPQPYLVFSLASICNMWCPKKVIFFHQAGSPTMFIWPQNLSALFTKAQPGALCHKSSLAGPLGAKPVSHSISCKAQN